MKQPNNNCNILLGIDDCGEGDSSRAHSLPDGHHDHQLRRLRPHLLRATDKSTKGLLPYLTKKGILAGAFL
ncbi:MAG: hypothetical protein IKI06_02610, partial [Prevotella sp.]|nr:hypothetical protein [Prevotella sp.]